MSEPKTGLVLTGGGARVAYQAGVIRALKDILPSETIPFKILAGTSGGGINAAYLAARASNWVEAAESLHELWFNLQLENIYRTSSMSLTGIAFAWVTRTLFGGVNGTRRANYLLDTRPLHHLIHKNIDFDRIEDHLRSGSLHAIALSTLQYFQDKTVSFFQSGEGIDNWERAGREGRSERLTIDHVLASAAIPVFFPPVRIGDQFYGDGCVRQTTPLSPAIHLGADRLLCIGIKHQPSANDPQPPIPKSPTIAQISGELFNALFMDPLSADAERLRRINDSIDKFRPHPDSLDRPTLRKIPILNLMPSRNLMDVLPSLLKYFPPYLRYLFHGLGASDRDKQGQALISFLAFFPECTRPMLELGYEDTLARKSEIIDFMAIS